MFLAAAALLVLLTVPLFGGSPARLATLHFRASWLLWLALGTQVVITEAPHAASTGVLDELHLLTYAAAGVFLWLNRWIPGLAVLALGTGLNAGTIALNGGTLPASASAMRAAGIHPDGGFDNSAVLGHPRLAWLGDVMTTPSWLPLRNVLSIGDLVIVAGLILLVHGVCRTRPWTAVVALVALCAPPAGAHRARRGRGRPGRTEAWPTTGMPRSSTSSAPTTA